MESGNYTQIEERIQKALAALSDESDLTITTAARQFLMAKTRLRQRAKGRKLRTQREGPG